jgi:hypothetical protein
MKHSLWLMPAPEDAPRMTELLERCARALGSPRFPPHITLLSQLSDSAAELVELTPAQPLVVTFVNAVFGDDYFHACSLRLHDDAPVVAVSARAAALLGGRASEQYPPHLSLAYGVLDEAQRQALRALLPPLPLDAKFDRVECWQTGGDTSTWQRVSPAT